MQQDHLRLLDLEVWDLVSEMLVGHVVEMVVVDHVQVEKATMPRDVIRSAERQVARLRRRAAMRVRRMMPDGLL